MTQLDKKFETLDGILKHNGPIFDDLPKYIQNFLDHFQGNKITQGSFESQVAAICDDIAYNNNDIDDGLYAGLFDLDELKDLEIINEALSKIKIKEFRSLSFNYILIGYIHF